MSPPSRRHVLRASALSLAGGFAGCSTASNDEGPSETATTDNRRGESECSRENLPYAVPNAPETFTPGSAAVRNESGGAVTVTLTLAHGGDSFYTCQWELDSGQRVTVDNVTEKAGTYTATVDVHGGGHTVYDWRIPNDDGWPVLVVIVREGGTPVAGCGSGESTSVTVKNTTDTAQTTSLWLLRDDEPVSSETVEIPADETTETSLSIPIGDFYRLVASSGGHEDWAEVAACSCYSAAYTTVTLDGSGLAVESTPLICD